MIKRFYRSISDKEIDYNQAERILRETNGVLLDVRGHKEYNEEHLVNAINIDLYNLEKEIQTVIPNKKTNIVAYCSCGMRSKQAQLILEKLGYYNVYTIKGGMYCRFCKFNNK